MHSSAKSRVFIAPPADGKLSSTNLSRPNTSQWDHDENSASSTSATDRECCRSPGRGAHPLRVNLSNATRAGGTDANQRRAELV